VAQACRTLESVAAAPAPLVREHVG
jgi:hypothetical protein